MAATSEMWPRWPDTPKYSAVGELGSGENFFEHLQRPALMRHDLGNPVIASQCHHLHRQGADIHSHASHRVFFWQHLIRTGVGFVFDRST